MPGVVGALDIGGTHASAARVRLDSAAVERDALVRIPLAPDGTRRDLLGGILRAATAVATPDVHRWGVAVPGPFDYENGVCTIVGVAKLAALHGVDLRAELASAVGLADPAAVSFLNDAEAFLLGEWWAGAARGQTRAIGITLGTGLGSAFLDEGEIVDSGDHVPPEGSLHLVPFRGEPVENLISRRGILASYAADAGVDVRQIADRARRGEERARETFSAFAAALAEFLTPWVAAFAPGCLVVGGSIAHSWDLLATHLADGLPGVEVVAAARIDEAAMLGAARHAALRSAGGVAS